MEARALMALIAEPRPGAVHSPIGRTEVTLPADEHAPPKYSDDAELKLVVQQTERCEAYLNSHWIPQYREADILYQGLRGVSAWEGTQVTKANVSRFTVAKLLNSVVPQLIKGIFFSDPPFQLRAFPRVSEETIRAKTAVFSELLNETIDGSSFPVETENGFENGTLFGTMFYGWGWSEHLRTRCRYVRKAQPVTAETAIAPTRIETPESVEWEKKEEEVRKSRPTIRSVDPRELLTDPDWDKPDVRRCAFAIERTYMSFDDLDQLRETPGYDIPSREELVDLFFPPRESPVAPGTDPMNSGGSGIGSPVRAEQPWEAMNPDPLQSKLEVLDYWSETRHITVVQRKLAIKSGDNEFGRVPYFSANWWNVPKNGRGFGLGRLVGQDQRIQTGLTNACLDIVSHTVNADYLVARGANVLTQKTRQSLGSWLVVDQVDGDVGKAFKLKEQPRVPVEALQLLQMAAAEGESVAGADQSLVQGVTQGPGRTSLGRTATGAAGMIAGSASRLDGPLERFLRQVFVPWLYVMDELVNDRMPSDQLQAIVGKKLGAEFKFDEEEFRNAQLEFEVLAGAHMAAKKAMSQLLPLLIEFFGQPGIAQQIADINGEFLDFGAVLDAMMEMAEWKYNRPFVKPLTPEMKQRRAAQNPALQKVQGQMALQGQKHQDDQENIDLKALTRAGVSEIERQIVGATTGAPEPLETGG